MPTTTKRPRFAVVEESSSDEEDAGGVEGVTTEGASVYFYAEVSRKTVLKLVQCLAKATNHALRHAEDVNTCSIYLYIHSGGGDAFAGLSAFDHIRNNRVHVVTVIDGYVASAATFLVLGGEHRVAMKHSTMLIHQLSTGFWGKFSDLIDEVQNSKSLMDTIKQVYADHTCMSKKKIECLLSKEKNMHAEKCLSLGFVHELW